MEEKMKVTITRGPIKRSPSLSGSQGTSKMEEKMKVTITRGPIKWIPAINSGCQPKFVGSLVVKVSDEDGYWPSVLRDPAKQVFGFPLDCYAGEDADRKEIGVLSSSVSADTVSAVVALMAEGEKDVLATLRDVADANRSAAASAAAVEIISTAYHL
jgi:hypothetical protein